MKKKCNRSATITATQMSCETSYTATAEDQVKWCRWEMSLAGHPTPNQNSTIGKVEYTFGGSLVTKPCSWQFCCRKSDPFQGLRIGSCLKFGN